jgi:hypothetical protein
VVNAFELAPFTLRAAGSSDHLSFQSTDLSLREHSPATLQEPAGSLTISEEPNDPVTVKIAGILNPSAQPIGDKTATLPASDLELETLVFETSTQTTLTLQPNPEDPLLELPELALIQGQAAITVHGAHASASDQLTGWAKIDASNVSIQSDPLSSDGISVQSQIDFRDLNTGQITSIDLSDESALTAILQQFAANLDWQANQISTSSLTARWAGGSLSLKPKGNPLQTTSSFSVGILEFEQLRLDQVYAESQHRGTLSKLEGHSQISAMLDSVTLQIDNQHVINSPGTDFSLSGEYTLSPVDIVHSDLPARFVPELAGLSLTATLQAAGRFEATRDAADSTLSLKLREGKLSYPPSQVNAQELELNLELSSLAKLDGGSAPSTLRIGNLQAGDLRSIQAESQFRVQTAEAIAVDFATVSLFGGQARLVSTRIPFDGSNFQSTLALEAFDLDEITDYIEIFDGHMQGKVSGYLPFRVRDGTFEPLRGELRLPDGTTASLRYQTKGLLTDDSPPPKDPTFSERLLKFLEIDPDRTVEEALGNITITKFETELFPPDEPDTPIRIRLEGTAHSSLADIPVVIETQVNGSLSELYNFIIRLNSL